MSSHKEVGNIIDAHSMLNVTADTLKYLRRHYTDAYIHDCLDYCSVGNRLALESIMAKKVSAKYEIEDKVQMNQEYRED